MTGPGSCAACDTKLDNDSRFCASCGARVEPETETQERACSACSAPLDPDSKFCAACGAKVEDPSPEIKPDVVESEPPEQPAANTESAALGRFREVVRQRPGVSVSVALLVGALVGRSASGDGDAPKSTAAAEARAARCAANLDATKQACRELADAASLDEPTECW